MPIVTGLFTTLDLSAGQPPQVVIRTRAYATSQTALQIAAATLAVVLALAALLLCARLDRRPRRRSLQRAIHSSWRARDRTDAVVVGLLLVWWVVGPTFWDDGWIWVEHRAYGDLGAISFYYDAWGIAGPIGFWLEWLRHWASVVTDDLVFARLPSLLALLGSWVLCRWCLRRSLPGRAAPSVRWALAAAFLVGAIAWGMTMRPEPFTSLLTAAGLAAMVSFVHAPRLAPLAIAVPAAVFAVNAHPEGLVAVAPLLAASPEIVRWLRAGGRQLLFALGSLLLACLALGLVLFTLDADLTTRLADARIAGESPLHSEPWWREYVRYQYFEQYGAATAPRRLSLALLLLSVLAWLTRRRAVQTGVGTLPARTVAAGLVLLAFVPSKWPWHFGALLTVCAVATAAETARLVAERGSPSRWTIRSVVALAIVAGVAFSTWRTSGEWGPLDLQEAKWEDSFGIKGYGTPVVAFVLAAFLAVQMRRQGIRGIVRRLPTTADLALPVASFAVVGLTVATLVVDAAISPWSPARQNLEALAGDDSCGLAHQLEGPENLVERLADPKTPTLLVMSSAFFFPCATIPKIEGGVVETPKLVPFESDPLPLRDEDSPFAAIPELYTIRTIARGSQNVAVLSVVDRIPGYVRADASRDLERP